MIGNAAEQITDTAPTTQEASIDELRQEIDQIDTDILVAVTRRTQLSREIGKRRIAEGGMRVVMSRENAIYEHYRDVLGVHGTRIASILLDLGRGKLGHELDEE